MHIVVAALIAVLVGLVVKFVLGVFEAARPYADIVGLVVAILVFLSEVGAR